MKPFRITNIYSPTISVVRNLSMAQLGAQWLSPSQNCNEGDSWGCSHHKSYCGRPLLISLMKLLTDFRWPISIHQIHQFLPLDCTPSGTIQPKSQRLTRKRQHNWRHPPWRPQSFCDLTLVESSNGFCHIYSSEVSQSGQPTRKERESHKDINTRRRGSWKLPITQYMTHNSSLQHLRFRINI